MLKVYLILSIAIFVTAAIIAIANRKKQRNAMSIALVGTLIAAGFLVFPLFQDEDIITQIINTVFYVLDIPDMKGDWDILENTTKEFLNLYKYTLYTYCVSIPILTVGVIISFLENILNELRSRIRTSKTVHIFSNVNEKSVTLAESITAKNDIVIMCNAQNINEYKKRIKDISGIILKKDINRINLNKYLGKIEIYEISEDEDENLNKTLEIIDNKKRTKQNITIYVFSKQEEAQIILDSTNKYKIKTVIVNETQQMVYRVLDEVPLYKAANNKNISTLIIGAGKTGKEFIKTITWCGQMIGYTLQINVIDKNANKIKNEFEYKYPELISNYDINFYEADINTIEAQKILNEKCINTNYIVVTMGQDSSNLNTAINLRKFFLEKNKKPIINLSIENSEKEKQISILKNERGSSYDILPFGSIEESYNKDYIHSSYLEKLAQRVHLAYRPSDVNLENYYKIEYNKKSSKATALHIKYKMYSILGEDDKNVTKFEELLKNQQIKDELAKNEHNRWNAYMRSDGYKLATLEKVKEYIETTNHHVYHLAKLHPAIVEFEKLDSVSEALSIIQGKKVDLKESDYHIVEAIPEILKV